MLPPSPSLATFDPDACDGLSVLLLAPHPDDEAIGCGGTAALLARAGASVQPLILARGDGGIGGQAVVAERRAESERACAALGVLPPRFGELSSPELRGDPLAAAECLTEVLEGARHDLLLVPSPLERHDTHRATLLAGLLADLAAPGAHWWGWGVWDLIPAVEGAVEIDVTQARAAKTRAVGAHVSQNASRPLTAAIAARDLMQAIFSRITGDEPRKAVERLLDLDDLARTVREALHSGGGPAGSSETAAEAVGDEPLEARPDRARQAAVAVGQWTRERCAAWAGALWPDAGA